MDAECDKCGREAVVFRVIRGVPLYLCAACFGGVRKAHPEKREKFKRYPREGMPIKGEYSRDREWKNEVREELWAKKQEATGE